MMKLSMTKDNNNRVRIENSSPSSKKSCCMILKWHVSWVRTSLSMFRPENRAAAHMGMDAVVHGDLPGHQHIVQSLRAMSGISKIFPGREMLPVQYQQIGSQTLGDKAPILFFYTISTLLYTKLA